MKIRLKPGARHFALKHGEVYAAALPAADPAIARLWGSDPSDPYRDGQGDYWVMDDPRLPLATVCVGADKVEVVE